MHACPPLFYIVKRHELRIWALSQKDIIIIIIIIIIW